MPAAGTTQEAAHRGAGGRRRGGQPRRACSHAPAANAREPVSPSATPVCVPACDDTETPYRVVDEDSILEQIMISGWPCDTVHGPQEPLRRRAAQALERWISRGLPYRVVDGRRRFSTAEVIRW